MKIFLPKAALIAITVVAANLFFASVSFGQTTGDYRSNAGAPWSTLTTWQRWNGGAWATPSGAEGYPGQFVVPALVTIQNTHNVNLDVSPANNIGSLLIAGGNAGSSLLFSGTNSLTVTGNIDISAPSANVTKLIAVADGVLSCASITMGATTNNNRKNILSINTGTVTVTGGITMNAINASRNSVTFFSTGTLNVGGGITGGGGLTTVIGSTINYNGAAQIVKAVAYSGNLTLSGSGDKDLTGVITIGGGFTISGSAVATPTGDLTIGGSVTLASGATFVAGAFTHNVGGNWINNGGTFMNAGSTINFNGTAQSIGGSSPTIFDNLSLSGFGIKTLNMSTSTVGDFSIDVGVVANLGTITTHTANSLTLGAAIQVSGSWGSTSSAAANQNNTYFAATSGIVTVASSTYYSIATGDWNANTTWSFSSGGPAVGAGLLPVAGDMVVIEGQVTITITANAACALLTFEGAGNTNTITVNPGITLDVSGAITIPRATGGANLNLIAVGAGTLNAGSIAFTASGNQPRHQITISTGTVTAIGDITTDAAGAGASITFSGAGTLNAGVGILTTTVAGGTLTTVAGSTVNYNGAAQTIKPINYLGNLTLSGSGDKTMTGVTAIGGNFTLSGTATTTAAAGITIGGIVTLESGTTFTAGAFTHNVAGNWINNGATFINTGSTINLNGAAQSIGGSTSTSFNNLTLAGTNTKTFGVATFADAALAINLGVVANLGTITTHSAGILTLNGVNQFPGTWGSTASAATNTNNTYFAATTGIVTVAGNFYSIANGNWNSNTTWSFSPGGPAVAPGIFPGAAHIVIIQGGFNVTATANAACLSITYGVANNSNTVTINRGVTLDVSDAINLPRAGGSNNNVNIMNVGAGMLNAGSIAFTNANDQPQHEVTISTGTVTVAGDITTDNVGISASIIFTGAGTLNAAVGVLTTTVDGGTLTTVAGSTVNYNGAAQTVKGVNYLGNVTLSGSGVKTLLPGMASIGGNLTLSGTASTTTISALTITGNLNMGDGTSFTADGFTFAVNGTTTVGGGTSGQLSINSTIGAKTFTGLVTIAPGGIWSDNTANSQVNFVGGITNNGTFSAGSSTTKMGGSFTNNATFNHNNGTVSFNGTTQSISGTATTGFNNVTISNTSGTVSLNGLATLLGTLSLPLPTSAFDADGAGSGVLTLLSTSATQAASIGIITTPGNFSGNVTVQRHMGTIIPNANRYISMPVTGMILNTDLSELGLSSGGFYYNEAIAGVQNNGWVQTSSNYALQSGLGFVTYNSPVSWDVRGPLTPGSNQGDVVFDPLISYTTTSGGVSSDGWNLVGNPYPSAINWSSDVNDWTKSADISPVVYVADMLSNQFIPFNYTDNSGEGGIIAMGQAFWIKANAANPSLTIHEQAKTSTGTGTFYRKSVMSPSEQLIISIQNEKYRDRAYLKINDKATDDFDHAYDGYKLMNKSLNIYLEDDAQRSLAMHTLRTIPYEKKIVLVIEANEPGDYDISFKNVENFSAASSLYLIDRLEGKAMAVTSGENYRVSISESSQPISDRFYISRNPQISERKISDWVQIYPNPVKDKLTIRIPANEKGTIQLMDNQGREILSQQIKGSFEMDMRDYPQGMYVLRFATDGEVVVRKIIK